MSLPAKRRRKRKLNFGKICSFHSRKLLKWLVACMTFVSIHSFFQLALSSVSNHWIGAYVTSLGGQKFTSLQFHCVCVLAKNNVKFKFVIRRRPSHSCWVTIAIAVDRNVAWFVCMRDIEMMNTICMNVCCRVPMVVLMRVIIQLKFLLYRGFGVYLFSFFFFLLLFKN